MEIGNTIVVTENYGSAKKGLRGVIFKINKDGGIGVDFELGFEGHNLSLHEGGALNTDTGYWITPNYIKVIEEEPIKK